MNRSYSELITLKSFNDRFRYLMLNGVVGDPKYGSLRYWNQRFYQSDPEWLSVRNKVILRDNACDLACTGHEFAECEPIIVHHINPITITDIIERTPILLDPNNLICVSDRTHKALHYGDESILLEINLDRHSNDTCLWVPISKRR